MEKDPICGAEIMREYAACQSTYRGRNYYFCCPSCQDDFDQDPERWSRPDEPLNRWLQGRTRKPWWATTEP